MQTSADSTAIDSSLPEVAPSAMRSSRMSSVVQVVMIAVFLLAMLFGYGRWRTGSFDLVWPWLIGQQLVFTPTQIDIGNVSPDQVIDKQIQVRNVSTTPITILGAQASCRCVGLDTFPIKVAAGEHQILKIRIASGPKPERLSHSIKFFYDGDTCSSVIVSVTGTIP